MGTIWSGDDFTFHDSSISDIMVPIPTDRSLGPNVNIYPVIPDFTTFADGTLEHTLRDDVEGQTWALERIVGRFYGEAIPGDSQGDQSDPITYWQNVQVGAGFFIAKVGDTDQSLPDGTVNDYDPLNAANTQNPWIWRRTWILTNPNSFDVGSPNCQTDRYADGGMIDSKVKRYIPREHRLFFAVSSAGWRGAQSAVTPIGPEVQNQLILNLDVRVLGGMRRAKNVSSF